MTVYTLDLFKQDDGRWAPDPEALEALACDKLSEILNIPEGQVSVRILVSDIREDGFTEADMDYDEDTGDSMLFGTAVYVELFDWVRDRVGHDKDHCFFKVVGPVPTTEELTLTWDGMDWVGEDKAPMFCEGISQHLILDTARPATFRISKAPFPGASTATYEPYRLNGEGITGSLNRWLVVNVFGGFWDHRGEIYYSVTQPEAEAEVFKVGDPVRFKGYTDPSFLRVVGELGPPSVSGSQVAVYSPSGEGMGYKSELDRGCYTPTTLTKQDCEWLAEHGYRVKLKTTDLQELEKICAEAGHPHFTARRPALQDWAKVPPHVPELADHHVQGLKHSSHSWWLPFECFTLDIGKSIEPQAETMEDGIYTVTDGVLAKVEEFDVKLEGGEYDQLAQRLDYDKLAKILVAQVLEALRKGEF